MDNQAQSGRYRSDYPLPGETSTQLVMVSSHTEDPSNPEDSMHPPTSIPKKSSTNSFILVHNLLKMSRDQQKGLSGPGHFRKQVVRFFKLHLNLCSSIGSIAFAWDKEKNEFGSMQNKLRRFQFYVHITIALVHNIFLVWNLASIDMGKFKISYKILAIYFTTGYCLCNGLRVFAWRHEKEIIKLMNANFIFEESIRVIKRNEDPDGFMKRLLKNSARSQKSLLILGLITGLSVPTLVFLILLANPCLPPFIGSIVFEYTEEHRCRVTSWPLHFIISVANFWMHLDMVLPMVFTMFSLFFLSVSCLHDYIEYLKRKITGKAVNEKRGETLYTYRQLQLMEKQLNACFRQDYFPLLLSGMTALLIFCLYSCIRLHDKIPMPGFSYFPIVALDGIVTVLVVNTKAANVLEHSLDLVMKLRDDTKFGRKHWVKKTSRSLTPLRINFMMNYVDKSTPLIFINFSLNQVVSLLLMGSERKKDVSVEEMISN